MAHAYTLHKVKSSVIALNGSPFQSYGASSAVWDHTCHPTQVNAFRLNPSQICRYSIYLPRRDERL